VSTRKQHIYRCDACPTEVIVEDGLPIRGDMTLPSRWWVLGPLHDYAAVRHLCSLECVRRMVDAAGDTGRLPLRVQEDG
jgi:hypothetical protein